MSLAEKIVLFSVVAGNFATALWTLLRACQTYKLLKDRRPGHSLETDDRT